MSTTTQRAHPFVAVWPGDDLDGRIDLGEDCVSFQARKSIDQPAGSWSLEILPRARVGQRQTAADIRRLSEFYRVIRSGAVVSFGMEEPGGIMAGQVIRTEWTRSLVGNTVSQGLVLSGMDFGQLFVRDSVIKASLSTPEHAAFKDKIEAALGPQTPLLNDLAGLWGPTEGSRDGTPVFEGKTVADVIDWALANAPSMRVPLFAKATGGTGRPAEFISTDFSVTSWNDGRIWNEALSEYQGTVWGFLRAVLDPDFYEITLQTTPIGGNLPSLQLVVRPKPFDSRLTAFAPVTEETGLTWEDLRTLVDRLEHHEILEDQLFACRVGTDNTQAFSYYQVTSKTDLLGNPSSLGEGLAYPLVDTYNAKHHGLLAYQASLGLVGGDVARKLDASLAGDYDSEIGAEVAEFRNRLLNWYRLNPFYETGTATIVGRDRIRPGDPIRFPWARPALTTRGRDYPFGMRYYCPAVSWSWSYGKPYVTELVLTRGANPSMIEAAKKLISDDAPASSPLHYAAT